MHSRHFFQLKGGRLQTGEVLFQLLLIFTSFLFYIILHCIIKIFGKQLLDNIERLLLI